MLAEPSPVVISGEGGGSDVAVGDELPLSTGEAEAGEDCRETPSLSDAASSCPSGAVAGASAPQETTNRARTTKPAAITSIGTMVLNLHATEEGRRGEPPSALAYRLYAISAGPYVG